MTAEVVRIAREDNETERLLLGAVLIDPAVLQTAGRLGPEDFSDRRHGITWRAICKLDAEHVPIDYVTLMDALTKARDLDRAGGPEYLGSLIDGIPRTKTVEAWSTIVRGNAQRRRLVALGNELATATRNAHDPAELLRLVERYRVALAAPIDPDDPTAEMDPATGPAPYRESLASFLSGEDEPDRYVIAELLPEHVLCVIHGEPRAKKSLAAFEIALAAATGTPAFGLARFAVPAPVPTLYVQEEDPRGLTRTRLRRLVQERCGHFVPTTMHVSVRRGVNLDDEQCVRALIDDIRALGVRLLVLDAARRLTVVADEGPGKIRPLTATLRRIVDDGDCTVVIVHHDVKPSRDGNDVRNRHHRASGSDWFAVSEAPIHVEQAAPGSSTVFPTDYKFSADPAPFTFTCEYDGHLIRRLVGHDETPVTAAHAGARARVVTALTTHGPLSKRKLKTTVQLGWETLNAVLTALEQEAVVDSNPGPRKSKVYFLVGSDAFGHCSPPNEEQSEESDD